MTFILAVPGGSVAQESIDFQAAVARGDSLLVVSDEVAEVRIDLLSSSGANDGPRIVASMNEHHRVRDLSVEFETSGFREASQSGYDLVMPVLSRWSFVHDVAITYSGILTEELATGAAQFQAMIVGTVKALSDFSGVSNPEHRLLLGAYREGLSSAEPLWRALSLYKVAEGVFFLRGRRRKILLDAGKQPIAQPSERVPKDVSSVGHPMERDSLAASLQPYAGKKFTAVLDDIRATLRNSIAHLEPGNNPLGHDTWADIQRVHSILPALRWMARQLLETELAEQPVESES